MGSLENLIKLLTAVAVLYKLLSMQITRPDRLISHKAKLTVSEVRLLRELHRQGVRQRDLAAAFHVSPATVSFIVRRRVYRKVA